jgi:hypothetical protein
MAVPPERAQSKRVQRTFFIGNPKKADVRETTRYSALHYRLLGRAVKVREARARVSAGNHAFKVRRSHLGFAIICKIEGALMKIRFMRYGVAVLALLALGLTLRAEDQDSPKKKEASQGSKAGIKPKVISPLAVNSTPIAEVVAQNVTIPAGTSQKFFAQSDFTGADKVAIGVYTTTDQNLGMTAYEVWWAGAGYPYYVTADYIDGKLFHFANTGGAQVTAYGNQLLIIVDNNGTAPVTIAQITVYATAR